MKIRILTLALAIALTTAANAATPKFLKHLKRSNTSLTSRMKGSNDLPQKSKYYSWDEQAGDWMHISNKEFAYTSTGLLNSLIYKDITTGTNVSKMVTLFDAAAEETGHEFYYWNGSAWELSSGDRSEDTYNAQSLLEERVYQNYNNQSQQWMDNGKTTYTYDANGNQTSEIYQQWVSGQWENSSKTIMTYDQNNNMVTQISQDWDGSQWVNLSNIIFTYTGNTITEALIQDWDFGQWYDEERITNITWLILNEEPKSYLSEYWDGTVWENSDRLTTTVDANGGTVALYEDWDGSQWVAEERDSDFMDSKGNEAGSKYEEYDENTMTWTIHSWTVLTHTYDGDKIIETITEDYDSNVGGLVNSYKEEFSDFTIITSVADMTDDKGIIVYPNPASDVLNIKVANGINSVSLSDINGRLIQAQTVNGQNIRMDVSNLNKGVYFLQINSDNGVEVKRIMKN